MSKPSVYLKLERRIVAHERGGLIHRWRYGRELLQAKVGRKQLPHGMAAELIAEAAAAGITISQREIARRVQFAETYTTEQGVEEVMATFGSWTALAEAEFPLPLDELDIDDLALTDGAPDAFVRQFTGDLPGLPGFKATVKVHGREIPINDATVPDLISYRDKFRSMHEGFAKTLDQIERTVEAILESWDGNPDIKAVDVYRQAAS